MTKKDLLKRIEALDERTKLTIPCDYSYLGHCVALNEAVRALLDYLNLEFEIAESYKRINVVQRG